MRHLFQIVGRFLTFTFYKVVWRRISGMVGYLITFLLLSLTVKEFWKSVNICRNYGQLSTGLFFYETRCMYMIHCNAHTHIHTHSYRCNNCNYKQCMYRPNFVSTISQQQMHLAISQAVTRILKNARYSPNLTTLCYHTALSTGEVLRNGYIHLSALIWA